MLFNHKKKGAQKLVILDELVQYLMMIQESNRYKGISHIIVLNNNTWYIVITDEKKFS